MKISIVFAILYLAVQPQPAAAETMSPVDPSDLRHARVAHTASVAQGPSALSFGSSGTTDDSIVVSVLRRGSEFLVRWIVPPSFRCSNFTVERNWTTLEQPGSTERWTTIGNLAGACDVIEYQEYSFLDEGAAELPAGSIRYRLNVATTHGETITIDSEALPLMLPERLELLGLYPQPAKRGATLFVSLPQADDIQIRIYDIFGTMVSTPLDAEAPEGFSSIPLGTDRMSSGMYLLQASSGGTVIQRSFLVSH